MVNPVSPFDQRQHESRARVLMTYMNPALKNQAMDRAVFKLAGEMGIKEMKSIQNRFYRLSAADRLRLDQLQQQGAHRSVLIQYIAATQDYELDGRPTRDKLFADFQKRQADHRSQRPFELAVRVAVPTLLVTVGTLVIPLAAAKITLALGIGSTADATLALATEVQHVLDPILKQGVELVAEETGGWLARSALVVGAWMGWNYAAHLTPDLKTTMFESETNLLDPTLGPAKQSVQMHKAIRAIPLPDRHLLGHLLPVELRAFLRGDDDERREILRRQPPPLMAQAKAILAANPPGVVNFFRAIRDLGDVCLPAAWRRGVLKNPRLDPEMKIVSWRTQRSLRVSAAPAPESIEPPVAPRRSPSSRGQPQ